MMEIERLRNERAPADTFVEIDASQIANQKVSISDLLGGTNMKIVVLRNCAEPQMLKARILSEVQKNYGDEFEQGVAGFLNHLIVPRDEIVAALVHVTNILRESKFIPTLFADLISAAGFPEPVVVDGCILRFYFPKHYAQLRQRRDLFQASDFISYPPHDEAGLPMCANLPVGPHRDIEKPTASLPINFWFPLQHIPEWRSLLFFPEALRKNLVSFPKNLKEREPSTWGYGRPLQFELNVGDVLLFHCEQFHSTPWSDLEPRLSGEIRVAACSPDDHSTYRRTFANLNNFRRPQSGQAVEMADRLLGQIDWRQKPPRFAEAANPAAGVTHGLLGPCFSSVEDARRSLCVYESDQIFKRQIASSDQRKRVFEQVRGSKPFAEDRLISCARLFAARDERDWAQKALAAIYDQSSNYFWCLEAARFALKYGYLESAVNGFEKAKSLAMQSDVREFRLYPELPITEGCRHLLPEAAVVSAEAALGYIRSVQNSKSNRWAFWRKKRDPKRPFVDARFFQPGVFIHKLEDDFHGYKLFACASFKVFVGIPKKYSSLRAKKAIAEGYDEYLQADSEQELREQIWRKTSTLEALSDFNPVDESVRSQIFAWKGQFVVAPSGLLKKESDVTAAVGRGDASFAATIDEAREKAVSLQNTYWPLDPSILVVNDK